MINLVNQGEQASSQRHAFISYVREDKARVDRLQEALEAAGVSVWRDTKDLWPGQNWEDKIRAAIKSDSLAFIACFSEHSAAREKSYQNAELALAADEYRLRPPTTEWLVPVRFSECAVPDWALGAGRTLGSLHRTDLFGDTETIQTIRLVQAVQRIVSPVAQATSAISPAVSEGIAELKKADSPRQNQAQEIKRLLRDPNGDITLEDVAMGVVRPVRSDLNDKAKFPTTLPAEGSGGAVAGANYFIRQIRAYDKALEPAIELVVLGAMYGLPRHEDIWTRVMQFLASTAQEQTGNTALLNLRDYPLVVLNHIASIAAISRGNFGTLRAFVRDPEMRTQRSRVPVVLHTGPHQVVTDIDWVASALAISEDNGTPVDENLVEGLRTGRTGKRYTPISDHIFKLLHPVFENHFTDDAEYADAFDQAEVFMDLIAADAAEENKDKYWGAGGTYGRYTWRHRHSANPPEKMLNQAFESAGSGWTPLLGGLFGGSPERAKSAFSRLLPNAEHVRQRRF
jgi:hypothetical protein